MKENIGAINPTTSLPPERHLHTVIELEDAVFHAVGMLELLANQLLDENRQGALDYKEPPWISGTVMLARDTQRRLNEAWEANYVEVRRLQFLGL